MTTMQQPGIDIREVTDVDRRTARRLGMDADKVNLVISTWAEEYLNYERQNASMRAAAAPAPAPAKRAPAKSTAKPARAPRKAAAKPAATAQSPSSESPSDADVAATEGSPS